MKLIRVTLMAFLIHVLALAVGSIGHAQSTSDYYDFSQVIGAGQVLCGVIIVTETTPRCFVGLGDVRTLTPEQDPSGQLARGSTNPQQGVFDSVEIRELMIETDESLAFRGETGSTAPRMLLTKISWRGRAGADLTDAVAYKDVAIGEISLSQTGLLQYRLIEIPTQMSSLGFFYPQKQSAQIFGGDSNSEEVKQSLRTWTQKVLAATLPEFIKNSGLAPAKGPQP